MESTKYLSKDGEKKDDENDDNCEKQRMRKIFQE
jgi:hypothetical protein